MKSGRLAGKGQTILLHAFCWVLFFSFPYLLRPSLDPSRNLIGNNKGGLGTLIFINCLVLIGLFYLNAFLLVPKFIKRKKFRTYGSILLSILLALMLTDGGLFHLLITDMPYSVRNFFSFSFFPILLILASSTAYRVIYDMIRADSLQKDKENLNLKTELSFLRSQVSPHFMFNILNNMVALARKRSDQLEPSLIKLSSLLRYMLYETDEKVSLSREVEYLESYIDLQRQRVGKNVLIDVSLMGEPAAYDIEPMLLVPFVENAFKHGIGLIENAYIHIELHAGNGMIDFRVSNRFDPISAEIKDKTPGIGLINVKRRLDLLYGQKHELRIEKTNGKFSVTLKIQLA